jgi:hypothetical protein
MLGHAHLQVCSKKVVNPSSSTQFPFQHSQFIAHRNTETPQLQIFKNQITLLQLNK